MLFDTQLYPKMTDTAGRLMLSLLIEQSLRIPSVYFEIYKEESDWKLYWRYQLDSKTFQDIYKEYYQPGTTSLDLLSNEEYCKKVSEESKTHSLTGNNYASLFEDLVLNGLPKHSSPNHTQRDGHSYIMTIFPSGECYYCGMNIPDKWSKLSELVTILAELAQLEEYYLPY